MNDDLIAKAMREGFDAIVDKLESYSEYRETSEKVDALFDALYKANMKWKIWERDNEGKQITHIPNPFDMVLEYYFLEMEKR